MVAGKRTHDDDMDGGQAKRPLTGNQPLLKLLVPNYVAGALIGKGGSLMTEMKEKFGGNIRLSANREIYPGTDERIIVLTGDTSEIIDLNNHIMEKVQSGTSKQPIDDARREKCKIVLTNGAAGLLIGRGGATIKAIQEETKAKISISNTEASAVRGERVLTMSGSMNERAEACSQVIEKISSDGSNMANTNLKYAGLGMGSGMGSSQDTGMGSYYNSMQQESINQYSNLPVNPMGRLRGASNMGHSAPSKLKTKVEVQMEVPDALVGGILGKQGQVVRDMVQRSGARFKFSDKNEYAEGTTDRILTITGDMNQCQAAYTLVNERVEQANSINSPMY